MTTMNRRQFIAAVLAAPALLNLAACGSKTVSWDGSTFKHGFDLDYRPYSYLDDSGEIGGFDVEMAQAVAFQRVVQALSDVPTVADAFEVFRRAAAGLDARQRLQRGLHACQTGDGGAGRRGDLLGQIEDAARSQAASARWRQLAGQDPRQHGLANAIAPDQTSGTRVEGFVESGKEGAAVRQQIRHAFQREIRSRHA